MKPPRQFKHPPRRRIVPDIRASQLPKPPKEAYSGDPKTMLFLALQKLDYCHEVINQLAQCGETGACGVLGPMREAMKYVRGAREGISAAPAPIADAAEFGRLD